MKLTKKILLLLSGTAIITIPVISVGCITTTKVADKPVENTPTTPEKAKPGDNDKEKSPEFVPNKKFQRADSPLLITNNEKINYVAFGDSITAGFNAIFDKDYKGEKLANGSIDGISYPAFLARALNQDGRVASFKNFAVTGSTIEDWNAFLFDGSTYDKGSLDLKMKKAFGDDYKNVIQDFKKRLADANLVTFSLGANDFISFLLRSFMDSGLLSDIISGKELNIDSTISALEKPFDAILKYVTGYLKKFIEKIKKLAPKANINIIGYPLPFFKLTSVINNYVRTNTKYKDFDFYKLFNLRVNETIKKVAESTGINFINAFNYDYWVKNDEKEKLTSFVLDIHPGKNGYKKIALDIYLKITNSFYTKKQFDEIGKYDFSQSYIDDDLKSSKHQIEVDNYKTSVNQLFGDDSATYINKETPYEEAVKPIESKMNFGKRIKRMFDGLGSEIDKLYNRIRMTDWYKKIDDKGLLQDFLLKHEMVKNEYGEIESTSRLQLLFRSIINSDFIETVFANIDNDLQKLIDESKGKQIEFKDIWNVFLKNLKGDAVLPKLIKALGEPPFSPYVIDFLSVLVKVFGENGSKEKKDFLKNIGLADIFNFL